MKKQLLAIILIRLVIAPLTSVPARAAANPVNPAAPTFIPFACPATPCIDSFGNVTPPAVTGATIAVHNGDNIQTIYDAAPCGTKLLFDTDFVFAPNFYFSSKQCNSANWITMVSANLPTVTPVLTLARINGASAPTPPNTMPKFTGQVFGVDGSNVAGKFIYIAGFEFAPTSSATSIVWLTNLNMETVRSQWVDSIIFDRVYIHGLPSSSTVQFSRGIGAKGNKLVIVNSYISDIYAGGDSQAIAWYTGGTGALLLNNFLSSSTEIVMAGGASKTEGYKCNIAVSPAPTTTTATVNTCTDDASGAVVTPVVGTCLMFKIGSATAPNNWTCVTANASGALTFSPAIPSAPDTGTAKVVWGELPTDITIKRNFFFRPLSWNPQDGTWDGITRSVKNFVEFKIGVRIEISGNLFINTWNAGQQFAMNFNSTDQYGDCPWCVSSDINVENNVWKNISGFALLIAAQAGGGTTCPGTLRRVRFRNNLLFPIAVITSIRDTMSQYEIFSVTGLSGLCTNVGAYGVDSLQVIHNNLIGYGNALYDIKSGSTPMAYTNLVWQDNLQDMGNIRWMAGCATYPDGTACITSTLNTNNTYTISHNAPINSGVGNGDQGVSSATLATRYGSYLLSNYVDTTSTANFAGVFTNYVNTPTDYTGFQLAYALWLNAASDGTNPGVNFTTLNQALGVVSSYLGPVFTGRVSLSGRVSIP